MARITQQSSIGTTGTSFENEPVIKSDGASSDVMEWAASTGSSNIKITEDSGNKLDLAVTGGLRVGTSTDALEDGELMVDSIEVRSDDNGAGVRIIGGKVLQLLNAANDTNADIINSGGSGVAQLGLRVAGDEKVTIASDGKITTKSDGNAIKLDGTVNTTRGIFMRNTGGGAHGYLHTDGDLKIIAEDSGKSIKLYTADAGTGTARMAISSTGLTTLTADSNGVDDETLKLAFDLSGTSTVMGSIGTTNVDGSNGGLTFKTVSGGTLGERLAIDSSGVVNISNLSASSDVQTDGSKNLITSSDKRLKNDIGELTAGLDIISNLQPHYFSWKSDETNTQQLGFYAQDVYEFLPEAAPREQKQNLVTPAVSAAPATYYEEGDELPEGKAVGDEKTPAVEAVDAVYEPATNEDGTPDYNWGFNGRPIIAALVAAVKELKTKVEALENA